jgi:ubiquinone/menaquinone biosynthesis C-methylase UbiE
MPKQRTPAADNKFYRQIGTHGWRDSDYFTFSAISAPFRRWMAERIEKSKADILSIGCGAGELEIHLATDGHRVVGLDISHHMLKRAMQLGLQRTTEADARFLPFEWDCFDLVIFPESIGHVPLDDVFREARRVLRPGGQVWVTTYSGDLETHPRYRKYKLADLASSFDETGFRVAEHRFLNAKRNSIADGLSYEKSTLLYIAAVKEDAPKPAPGRRGKR